MDVKRFDKLPNGTKVSLRHPVTGAKAIGIVGKKRCFTKWNDPYLVSIVKVTEVEGEKNCFSVDLGKWSDIHPQCVESVI